MDRRKLVLRRELDDALSVRHHERVGHGQERIRTVTEDRHEGGIELGGGPHLDQADLHPEGLRRGLRDVDMDGVPRISRVVEDCEVRQPGDGLLEELQALDIQVGREAFDAREIPAGPGQAREESDLHPSVTGYDNDGDGAGRLLGRESPDVPGGDDHVRLELDEFRGKVGEALELAMGEFEFEHEVVALDVAKVPQALDEGIDLRRSGGPGQVAEAPDLPQRLRLGCEGREEDAEGEGDDTPDGAAPPRGLLPLVSCMPAMILHTADMRAHDTLLAAQDTPPAFRLHYCSGSLTSNYTDMRRLIPSCGVYDGLRRPLSLFTALSCLTLAKTALCRVIPA